MKIPRKDMRSKDRLGTPVEDAYVTTESIQINQRLAAVVAEEVAKTDRLRLTPSGMNSALQPCK